MQNVPIRHKPNSYTVDRRDLRATTATEDAMQAAQPEQQEAKPEPPDGRKAVVFLSVRLRDGLRLLFALRDELPFNPSAELREAIISLLYFTDPAARTTRIHSDQTLREVLEARIAELSECYEDVSALLNVLPLQLPNERANRALARIARSL